jgi:hypothetical protein
MPDVDTNPDVDVSPIADVILEFIHALTHQCVVSKGLFPSSRRSSLFGAHVSVVDDTVAYAYLEDVFDSLRIPLAKYVRTSASNLDSAHIHQMTDCETCVLSQYRGSLQGVNVVFTRADDVLASFEFRTSLRRPPPPATQAMKHSIHDALSSFATRFVLMSEDDRFKDRGSEAELFEVVGVSAADEAPALWTSELVTDAKGCEVAEPREILRIKRSETDAFVLEARLVCKKV